MIKSVVTNTKLTAQLDNNYPLASDLVGILVGIEPDAEILSMKLELDDKNKACQVHLEIAKDFDVEDKCDDDECVCGEEPCCTDCEYNPENYDNPDDDEEENETTTMAEVECALRIIRSVAENPKYTKLLDENILQYIKNRQINLNLLEQSLLHCRDMDKRKEM